MTLKLTDGYKTGHIKQYAEGTTKVYSNWTPRMSRVPGVNKVVLFGLQYFIKKYLIEDFDNNFFGEQRNKVVASYKRRIDNYLGPDAVGYDHVGALWDLGYLPLEIKAIPEGKAFPLRTPQVTIVNTVDEVTKNYKKDNVILVAPDAGSIKKVAKLGYEYITCDKTRDVATGKLSGFVVHADKLESYCHYIIVDDICDGGGTFVGLLEKLKEKGADEVSLAVTHGIFSKGLGVLKGFYRICTTDSFLSNEKLPNLDKIKLSTLIWRKP